MAVFDRTDGGGEVGYFLRLVGFDRAALGAVDTVMRRQFELNAPAFSPGAAVLNVMGEAFLPTVKIDRGDALEAKQVATVFASVPELLGAASSLPLDAAWRRFVSCVALPSHRLMPAFDSGHQVNHVLDLAAILSPRYGCTGVNLINVLLTFSHVSAFRSVKQISLTGE